MAFATIDPMLLTIARDLCADSGDHNREYVRGCAELIIDYTYGLDQDQDKDTLIRFLGAPLVNPNGPLTDAQRAALFVLFHEVFGHGSDETRYAFTRMVLGLPSDRDVSWSSRSPSAITHAEASKVLDALDALNV